jgi:hypothetical protein
MLRLRGAFRAIGVHVSGSTPCITTRIIDGAAITPGYYPDTQDLRISDAYGTCTYRAKWLAPRTTLHAAMQDLARSRDANLDGQRITAFSPIGPIYTGGKRSVGRDDCCPVSLARGTTTSINRR